MPTSSSAHRKGLVITAIGGLALSFDIPLIRLADGDVWPILAVRSICTFVAALVAWFVLSRVFGRKASLIPGKAGLAVGLLYGANVFTFMLAVFNTATANVVFILAFTSMFAAILSWVFLKERPSNATFVTMVVMLAGIGIIVSDGLVSGNFFGDAMAALTALIIACAITISRGSGRDMALVPLATAILPAIGAFLLIPAGGFQIENPGWIAFNGLVMIPLAYFCLASGPRYLSAPEVGMFYLLETILAPIWVWVIFTETPTWPTLLGGSILILALISHSAWQIRHRADKLVVPTVH